MTHRKILDYWTETHRIDERGEVKITCCSCKAPGATPRQCADATGNKTPCRCFCHNRKPRAKP